MSARFEVVRTDTAQSWHARLVVNGHVTWWTEKYARKVGAERAIVAFVAHAIGSDRGGVRLLPNVPGVESVIDVADSVGIHPPLVHYIDERVGAAL